MIDSLRQIKKLALEMHNETSRNDSRRERLQDICDLADDLITHQIGEGR